MKKLKQTMKWFTSSAVLGSMRALGACGEQQQQAAAPQEAEARQEVIVWKVAQTWGTGFPIIGDEAGQPGAS